MRSITIESVFNEGLSRSWPLWRKQILIEANNGAENKNKGEGCNGVDLEQGKPRSGSDETKERIVTEAQRNSAACVCVWAGVVYSWMTWPVVVRYKSAQVEGRTAQNAAQNERDTMKTFLLLAALAFVSLAGAADPNVAIVPSLVDEREAFFFSSTITLTLTTSTVVTSTCYSSTTACARRRRGIFADEVHESIQPSAVHRYSPQKPCPSTPYRFVDRFSLLAKQYRRDSGSGTASGPRRSVLRAVPGAADVRRLRVLPGALLRRRSAAAVRLRRQDGRRRQAVHVPAHRWRTLAAHLLHRYQLVFLHDLPHLVLRAQRWRHLLANHNTHPVTLSSKTSKQQSRLGHLFHIYDGWTVRNKKKYDMQFHEAFET